MNILDTSRVKIELEPGDWIEIAVTTSGKVMIDLMAGSSALTLANPVEATKIADTIASAAVDAVNLQQSNAQHPE